MLRHGSAWEEGDGSLNVSAEAIWQISDAAFLPGIINPSVQKDNQMCNIWNMCLIHACSSVTF
jgi:hypothetical protein